MSRNAKLLALALATALVMAPAGVAQAASSPAVVSGNATAVDPSSALLHGSVNPNGAATKYRFEWGVTTDYGSASPMLSAGHGEKFVTVQAPVEGLVPGTTYHYRLVASNRFGGTSGADRTFRTKGHPPPAATTGAAMPVGLRSATVSGTVEPNGEATAYKFEYGLTSAYGLQTAEGTVPAGSEPAGVSAQLEGLAPGTVFHYRLVALHAGIASYGADASFVTLPLRQQRARVRAKTRPRRSRRRPHVFTTTGRVLGGPGLPPSARCSGSASVALLLRKHRVAFKLVAVQPDCSFSARTRLRHLPPRARRHRRLRLRVFVRFRGNDYLAPARARGGHVVVRMHRSGRPSKGSAARSR